MTWAAHTRHPYAGARVGMDVGDGDPFHDTDVALAHDLQRHGADITFHVFPGGHDWNYWDAHTSDYVRFYTAALRDC